MNSKLKLLGALMVAGAFSTGALAQTAATPAAGGDASATQSGDMSKAEKKAQKKQKKQMKRDRNQNGANGPAETSSKPQPAAGTGSQ